MATLSPAPSNNSTDTVTTPTPTTTTTAAAIGTPTTTTTTTTTGSPSSIAKLALTPQREPTKSLRGLNKPKCSQCGNVARSRCPYVSCKSCCAKAQNPCPIHVLKQNGTVPDKTQTSASLLEQKSTDASSQGASLRVSSLRQLSQFNGTQVPARARRPLTRKDAAALNQWRFSKLKEYKERDIEAENEAFDRYMQNVSLLEEVFLANHESPIADEMSAEDPMSANKEENTRAILLGIKAQLRSNPRKADNFKKRIHGIVDQGLRKLRKWDLNVEEETTDGNDLDGLKEVQTQKKPKCLRDEQASAVDELVDKLNKSRNEEELQSCLEMKSQLFNQHGRIHTEKEVVVTPKEKTPDSGPAPTNVLKYRPPALWTKVGIDQETIHTIDIHFSSLDQIEDL
ncbi:hypothetical protein AQUCO_04400005v1 [Aquilegia coerulea]|uniref:Uncharacterized protein n=1 Tax=Aquilegia coerulea TaxID=218851 RepID=A0A2G5CMP0_AQUCA|nr:hypothetical protein AQUCO_04400005v1 [Aquilegia coerulea]